MQQLHYGENQRQHLNLTTTAMDGHNPKLTGDRNVKNIGEKYSHAAELAYALNVQLREIARLSPIDGGHLVNEIKRMAEMETLMLRLASLHGSARH